MKWISLSKRIRLLKEWWWTLYYHRRIIAQLDALVSKDLQLSCQKLHNADNAIKNVFQNTLMKAITVLCVDLLRAAPDEGRNSVTCDLMYQGQRYEFTVQKAWTKTPGQRIEELSSVLPQLLKYMKIVQTELIVFEGGPSGKRALGFLNLVEKWCKNKALEMQITLPPDK